MLCTYTYWQPKSQKVIRAHAGRTPFSLSIYYRLRKKSSEAVVVLPSAAARRFHYYCRGTNTLSAFVQVVCVCLSDG